jgi:hypothetical protein
VGKSVVGPTIWPRNTILELREKALDHGKVGNLWFLEG